MQQRVKREPAGEGRWSLRIGITPLFLVDVFAALSARARSIFDSRRGPIRKDWPSRRHGLADKHAGSVAFGQSEQIVLPLPVSVCPEIRGFVAIAADDVDIHFFSS
jgi:hypothetical protein